MSMHVVGAVVWGALGIGCVVRGFFRPVRAVVKEGEVRRCAGDPTAYGGCDPTDVILTIEGDPVYSTASAKVVEVGPYYVHLLVQNEPVILMYSGIEPSVEVGQHVGVGQKIGKSEGEISFSVTQYKEGMRAESVPPSAWLAVRGLSLIKNNVGSESPYCVQGRDIVVPAEAQKRCNLRSPSKAGFALLPVTVELE